MTDRNPIADITTKLEERLAARLVDQIRHLLAGRTPEVQRAVLLALAAEWPIAVSGGAPRREEG